MVESYGMIFTQKNFEELQMLEKEFKLIPRMHLYMVIKTPKYKIVTLDILSDGSIKLEIGQEGTTDNLEIQLEFIEKNININMSNNRDEIEVIDKFNNTIFKANVINLLLNFEVEIDCEVVYIGQSFGTDGNRNVIDRLKSHSTLQKIYFEKEDERSIYLTAWNFDRNTLTMISPNESYDVYSEKMIAQLKMVKNPYDLIAREQEITITEAALIRYFQPKYNTEYKKSFPSKNHSDYDDFFKMNLDYIAVEMDTTRLKLKLYSERIKSNFCHNIFFDLKEKRHMNNFFGIE